MSCKVPNCKECIHYFFHCEVCNEGYFKMNKACFFINDNNCEIYNEYTILCKICKKGYYLNNNKCLPC